MGKCITALVQGMNFRGPFEQRIATFRPTYTLLQNTCALHVVMQGSLAGSFCCPRLFMAVFSLSCSLLQTSCQRSCRFTYSLRKSSRCLQTRSPLLNSSHSRGDMQCNVINVCPHALPFPELYILRNIPTSDRSVNFCTSREVPRTTLAAPHDRMYAI